MSWYKRTERIWRRSVWVLLALHAGCVHTPTLVPDWAKHVKRKDVDRDTLLALNEELLRFELRRADYQPNWTAPEQIAALAVKALSEHPFDAAVLIALASYRRHQQAEYASLESGDEAIWRLQSQYRVRIDRARYLKFVQAEIDTIHQAVFDAELRRLAVRLGGGIDAEAFREDIARIAMGNLHDLHGAQLAIDQRLEKLKNPEPERLGQPELADALLDRLTSDAGEKDRYGVAIHYLAQIPLRAFRSAALDAVRSKFDGSVVRTGLRLYAQDPESISASLSAVHPATRLHAAIIVGIAQDLPRITQLQETYSSERDPWVRRAIAFALVQLGEHQYLSTLIDDARPDDWARSEHAIILLHWLPLDVQLEIPQRVFVDAIHSDEASADTRFLAAMTLANMASRTQLEDDSLRAIFRAASSLENVPDAFDLTCRAIGRLERLDRHHVLVALRNRAAPMAGWLARAARVSTAADLPLLEALMQESKSNERRAAIVTATAAIKGRAAQMQLQDWCVRYPELRRYIAIQLVLRGDVDKPLLHELARELDDDPSAALLELVLGEPAARSHLNANLRSEDPECRYTTLVAVRLFGNKEYESGLWLNANFQDNEHYPADVKIRQLALGALLDLGLNRSSPRSHGESATARDLDDRALLLVR